jgi:hypothetical protein
MILNIDYVASLTLTKPILVVGVDFGTTFSGFSYALWDANSAITRG